MRILMLAPEPFFKPRGTPISIYFRIKALSDLGHQIDLITYPIGEDVKIKNLDILRIPPISFIQKIKIGPSFKKIPLDFLLLCKAFIRLIKKRYDLIFSHEEAALIGVIMSKLWRHPHVYDMHSSLPQQLDQYEFFRSQFLKRIFLCIENFILKNSQAVLVVCPALLRIIEDKGCRGKSVLLENFLDFEHLEYSLEQIERKKKELTPIGEKIVLYAGNFQPYQGLSLLLEAAAEVKDRGVVFILVGGTRSEREKLQKKAAELKISNRIHFIGTVPPFKIPLFLAAADVLVSPRVSGTNIPLKIYSYLKSGKPVLATRLLPHTQILNEKISILVKPDGKSMAEGISFALHSKEAKGRARETKEWAEREYIYSRYLEKIKKTLEIARAKKES